VSETTRLLYRSLSLVSRSRERYHLTFCLFHCSIYSLGAFGLPFGLIMTLVTGGELFTGNTALVTAAKNEGKITTKDLIKNWSASYLGNFVGSLILAYLAYKSGTLGDLPGAVNIATAKCSLAWEVAFVRGILCNWLVCMAVRAMMVELSRTFSIVAFQILSRLTNRVSIYVTGVHGEWMLLSHW